MNRTQYLKTASAILNGRSTRPDGSGRPTVVQEIAGQTATFERGIAKLELHERAQMLEYLAPMLERERRRCKARAGRYDAGRHISLYLAVKSLRAC